MIARARFKLNDASNDVRIHDLVLVRGDQSVTQVATGKHQQQSHPAHRLPLFGHLCCRLAAQANICDQHKISGYLTVREDAKQHMNTQRETGEEAGAGVEYWASLGNFKLTLSSGQRAAAAAAAKASETGKGAVHGRRRGDCISKSATPAAGVGTVARCSRGSNSGGQSADQVPDLEVVIDGSTTVKGNCEEGHRSSSSFCLQSRVLAAPSTGQSAACCYVISVRDEQSADEWVNAIERQKREYATWERILLSSPMPILSPRTCIVAASSSSAASPTASEDGAAVGDVGVLLRPRAPGSMYAETPVMLSAAQPAPSASQRLLLQQRHQRQRQASCSPLRRPTSSSRYIF